MKGTPKVLNWNGVDQVKARNENEKK